MTRKPMLLIGVCLAVLVLGATLASAAPTASGPVSVKAAATPASPGDAVRICQRPLCRLRCRTVVLRRRCRPASLCRFKTHVICRCYYQRGRCYLRCKSRLIVRRCTRGGMCRAPVRICQCGVPMVRPRPPR
ncbi:MAG: hypothetical protein KJ621_00745 [Proteobacteria bacterium]|nr:hypothetical protein [Pseudomonadota bacterium]